MINSLWQKVDIIVLCVLSILLATPSTLKAESEYNADKIYLRPDGSIIVSTLKAESEYDADRYNSDDEMKRFNLDPEGLEYICIREEFSVKGKYIDPRMLIAYFKSGEIKVFDYTSKKLISKTLPNGDIEDRITHELLKTTSKHRIYEVFKENKFCYKIQFLEEGEERIFEQKIFDQNGKLIQHIDKNDAKRYLVVMATSPSPYVIVSKDCLLYRFAVKENK